MQEIDRWFWLLLIVVTLINALVLQYRAEKTIAKKPELRAGYQKLLKGYLIFLNLPWLVMGAGILLTGLNLSDYSRPRAGNAFVLAFHAVVIGLLGLCAYWIYFRGGAEFLIRHPGAFRYNFKDARVFKVIYALVLLVGIGVFVNLWLK